MTRRTSAAGRRLSPERSEPAVRVSRPTVANALPHTASATCWCQPTTSYEDPLTGDRVFTHKRTQA